MTKKAAKPAKELILDKPLFGCPRGRVFILNETGGTYSNPISEEEALSGNMIRYTYYIHEVQAMGKDWFKSRVDYVQQLPTTFSLTSKEEEEADKFKAAVKEIYGEWGMFRYTFSPTGIGSGVEIHSDLANTSKNITDIDSW